MKTNPYKKISYLFIIACVWAINSKAQGVPVPPPPAPPAPPQKDFNPSLPVEAPDAPNIEWEEFGKKFEKAFKGFDSKMKDFNLSMVDFDKQLGQKLKNIKIEIPSLPKLPELPELPAFRFLNQPFSYQTGALENASEKVKKLTKTYPADANDILAIENSYGRITVNTWDKNEIKVDVEVKAYADDKDKTQKLLDGVNISNSKNNNEIIFKTIIDKNKNGSNWMSFSFWNNDVERQKIDVFYTVYMPAKNPLNLKTNYTNIILPDLEGAVGVNMNYGDLTSGKLSGLVNKISSNYGKVDFASLNNATIFCNYGSFKATEANNLNGNFNYAGSEIGALSGDNSIKINYSPAFKVAHLAKDFKSLNINANYSTIGLAFDGSENFNFDISTNYASFKYDDAKTKITYKYPDEQAKGWSSSKVYKGYYGKASSDKNITVRSNYGSVKFN